MYPRTHKLNLDRLTKKLKLRLININGLSTIMGNVPSAKFLESDGKDQPKAAESSKSEEEYIQEG